MTVNVSKQTAYVVMLSPVMAIAKQTAYFVMLPATETLTLSINARIEIAASLDTADPTVDLFLNISARIELQVTPPAFTLFPPFLCDAPAPKTWTAAAPTETAWVCATVVPAEECTEDEDSDNDLFAYVDGNRLAYVNDDRLKYA